MNAEQQFQTRDGIRWTPRRSIADCLLGGGHDRRGVMCSDGIRRCYGCGNDKCYQQERSDA